MLNSLIPDELYSWGAGSYGQLGTGGDLNKPTPQRVEELKNIHIMGITARADVSGALDGKGKVYTWGRARV
jgi:alpha-tubulin suppressor-like RCC1 family protein